MLHQIAMLYNMHAHTRYAYLKHKSLTYFMEVVKYEMKANVCIPVI